MIATTKASTSSMMGRATQSWAVLLLTVLCGASISAQSVLIKDLKALHSAVAPAQHGLSILIEEGQIKAIGKDLVAPEGATIIDGKDLHASPGIIDAHSHIAAAGGLNEGTDPITCEVRTIDVLNPEDRTIYRALAGGCTAAHIMHGSANVIGGQNAVIKLKWKESTDNMVVRDVPRTVKFALGENPKRSNSRSRSDRPRRFPSSRMGVEALLREAFEGARTYRASWLRHAELIFKGKPSVPPRRDLRKEALVDILAGRLEVHCHCYRADEILMIMQIADEYGFKVKCLHHVLEGYKVAPEIAAHGAGASTFADWWGYKMEAYDAVPYNAAIMHRNGVATSIKSDSGDHIRRLNVEAAKAVKYGGVDPVAALAMVTKIPAQQLGMLHRTGTLEVGKDADIALWTDDPLSSLARCQRTLIEGKTYFERGTDLKGRHDAFEGLELQGGGK